ncbi:MAG TPA: DUF2855 family protein [Candidatus Limnocylindria bacterium]|nr:DUF2855 family protein [Candidatus Limnocylindria bacterium]
MSEPLDFVVDRQDLRRTAFVPGACGPDSPLADSTVRVRVDTFALTSNNVTYGVAGDLMGYWGFFPAADGWGRIPVWGFGDVVRSSHPTLVAGERLYGYFPISTYVDLRVGRVTPSSFTEVSPHRTALPPFYNEYARVAADPGYTRANEGVIAIFRPLFATGFLLDDFIAREDGFGARRVVLSSASSKTALALAFLLSSGRRGEYRTTGLTSPANAVFVRGTGYYDDVVLYDDIATGLADEPAVFVDFAGNSRVVGGVHQALGERLRYSCQVGITHWDRLGQTENLPGPAPVLFFAPDHAQRRLAEWGPEEFAVRVGGAMQRFLAAASSWLRITAGRGPAAVDAAYRALLDGRADPAEGHVLSL